MAQVSVIKVTESSSHLVIRLNILGDSNGDLVNQPILSPSDLNPVRPNNIPAFRIMKIWGSPIWFDAVFYSGLLSPVLLWTFARDCDFEVDLNPFGGVIDQNVYLVPPPDDSGVLNISTNNLVQGSVGVFVLELRKTNAAS